MSDEVLIIMTKAKTLALLDGSDHASGFWAEEFVVPYERITEAGYSVTIATIGGDAPTADEGSLNPAVVGYTRPAGSPDHDEENVAHYRKVIDSLPALRAPVDVATITPGRLESFAGVYISGGHGAMGDMPHDRSLTFLVSQILRSGKPFAVVCHGQSALLPLRDSESEWPLKGYRMTAFSHDEELQTEMAGQLPFVLQFELQRLGARYEKADAIWGSHVVEDRSVITGQNPYSSAALADAFLAALGKK